MEFVAGRALSDVLLKEGKLSSDRVIQILRQICGALDEAHQLGIVHRDLKPDNIILTPRAGEQDFVKVLDFGIAARTESADAAHEQKLTQQGTVLGTPPYMSPEQFTGKPLDRRSDVYSLGVMAYEMLTGKLPFDAETPWQWATQHMTAQPRPFEVAAPQIHIADGMRQAILRSLSKEADQRQAGAGQFFAELSAGVNQGPGTSPGVGAPAALPYQATAAMPEMSGFGATPGVAHAAVSPAGASPVGSTVATPAVAPAMAVPMIAAPRPRSGKTGLVLGLGGAGLALVAVIVVVLIRSNKPADDPALSASTAAASAAPSAQATLSAEIPQDTAGQLTGQSPPPTLPRETVQHKATSKTSTTASSAASTKPTTPQASTTPVTNPPASVQTPQPTAPTNAACNACMAAAASGDLAGAARSIGACTDPKGKSDCQNRAKNSANRAGQMAMANHDCGRLNALKSDLASLGTNSSLITAAAANCH